MPVCVLADPIGIGKALDLVGAELCDQRMFGEIIVCPGSVFLLRYGWTDDGTRIEVDTTFASRIRHIRQACEQARQAARLLDGWLDRLLPRLCRDGGPHSEALPTRMYRSWERLGPLAAGSVDQKLGTESPMNAASWVHAGTLTPQRWDRCRIEQRVLCVQALFQVKGFLELVHGKVEPIGSFTDGISDVGECFRFELQRWSETEAIKLLPETGEPPSNIHSKSASCLGLRSR